MGEPLDGDRRLFLKQFMFSLGKTVYEYHQETASPSKPDSTKKVPARVGTGCLRPPGAVEEELFLQRCTRCGDCLPACPFGSIQKEPATGYPIIVAKETPCYLCPEFPCISACSTTALLPIEDPTKVRMGLAVVSRDDCLADQGCRSCVARCPVEALSVVDCSEPYPVVEQEKCVGCGICEETCSTVNDQIAITVLSDRPNKAIPHSDL
jgi:ferredoxin-type protein NapG